MQVLSENSEEDLEKRAATESFERALSDLAVNMLRVIAGAGEPGRLLRHIHECAVATQDYRDLHSEYPSAFRVAERLDFRAPDNATRESWADADRDRWYADGTVDRMLAEEQIRQASLRVIAARWAGNATVRINAERLLSNAIRRLEEANERHRRAILWPPAAIAAPRAHRGKSRKPSR